MYKRNGGTSKKKKNVARGEDGYFRLDKSGGVRVSYIN